MRLYIIGPVTGREDLNREAFEGARKKLELAGYEAAIPHSFVPSGATHEDAMAQSIRALLDCDGVAMLDDWATSPGALLENRVATACGLQAHCVGAWLLMAGVYPGDDNSPEDTPNPPSDEVPGALTRRMDETNALLRVVYNQIAALITVEAGSLANSANSSVIESIADTMETALSYPRKANEYFEAAESASRADHFADTDKKVVGE